MPDDETRRRPGRRPLDRDDPSVAVSFRVPSRRADALYQQAKADRITLPELIRRSLPPAAKKIT